MVSTLDRLGLTDIGTDRKHIVYEKTVRGMGPVEESEDLTRVLQLPRRHVPTREEQKTMAKVMTAMLRRENDKCMCSRLSNEPCLTELMPIQGWYLYEAMTSGGMLGHIVVGGGKTGLGALTAMVMPGVKTAVLLLPPGLRKQFRKDFDRWSQHFKTPNLVGGRFFTEGRPTLEVLAYSELSHETRTEWLNTRKPDLIICDEVQNLSDPESVRTHRFLRYFVANPQTKLCAHAGTLTTKSIKDYAHLSALALREKSPLPLFKATVDEWAEVLDPERGFPRPPGALRDLAAPGETVRAGFRRRLQESPGVVTTQDARLDIGISLTALRPPVPAEVEDMIATVRDMQQRPDGEEFTDAIEVARCVSQVACGFFYRWRYPRGEPEELILEWFEKRQAWNRELRERLTQRETHLDSPKLLEDAAKRSVAGESGPLVWHSSTYKAWADIRDRVKPEQDTVWVNDFLAKEAVEWGKQHIGIIWYEHDALGQMIAKLGDFHLYDGGDVAARGIVKETGERTIVASIKAHGTGRNLQHAFHKNLFTSPPSSAGTWEQTLGRTYRTGQRKNVEAYVFVHVPSFEDAFYAAEEKAKYIHQTTGQLDKILYAKRFGI